MSSNINKWLGVAAVLGAGVFLLAGCGKTQPGRGEAELSPAKTATAEQPDHSGWWCVEHGVPEGICAQCNTQVAADFKKKGDWCKEHNRPESQCFICHPDLEAKFAAQYEAKFGKKPTKPTE
jgi:cobalt-zinc-cadmium efflux system membrane fusion protein